MRIDEMFGFQPPAPKLDFDLHDDLMFYMNNDPEFYRKDYYPFLNKFRSHCDAGRSVTPKAFVTIVKKAYEGYKQKFDLPELDESLSDEEIGEICGKLQTHEIKHHDDEKNKKLERKKK